MIDDKELQEMEDRLSKKCEKTERGYYAAACGVCSLVDTDIPRLIAEVRRLRKENAYLRDLKMVHTDHSPHGIKEAPHV